MGNDRPGTRPDEGEAPALVRARRGRARSLALGLQGVAVGWAAVAAARGGPPSAIGTLVVLLVAAAVCVNRQSLFPAELSITAEASVVLCAVVVFRRDAPVLAPMLVGLASGWLDSYQWASRAWIPMAFNSGNRGVEAMLAALSFHTVTELLGSSPSAIAGAAVVAAAVFAVVDNAAIATLVVVRDGTGVRRAVQEVVRLDALSFPIALLGASCGLLGLATTGWVGAAAVMPAAWIPDALLVGRGRAPHRLLRWTAGAALSIAIAITVGLFVGFPPVAVTGVLTVLGVLAGLELRANSRLPVPPALGAVVVLGACAVAPSRAVVAAVLVAVAATSVSWSFARVRVARVVVVLGCVIGVAVGVGLVAQAGGSSVVAVAVFAVGVFVVSPRRDTGVALGWAFPFVVLGATATELRAWFGPFETLAIGGAAVLLAAPVIAWTGAPPWPSRLAAHSARLHAGNAHRSLWVVIAVAAVACASVSILDGALDGAAVVGLALVGELAAALALARVRLWRFAPRRRAVEVAACTAATAASWCAALLAAGHQLEGLVLAVCAVTLALTVGWSTIAVADRAEARRRGGERPNDEARR
ncbi:MAG TPA: hypothetical protein VFZ17_11505 [Acidimicrobiia bacterium]|nr:hypothetical protein [Acidimicrobiia bacterium]